MVRDLKRIQELHQRVIHGGETSMRAIYAEGRQIARIDYNELNSVCEDCFRDPS